MRDWTHLTAPPSASIRDTLEHITKNRMQICLVVDEAFRLLGTVTDGDIRVGILKGLSLDDAVSAVMNSHPVVARREDDPQTIVGTMKLRKIRQMPVVDGDGRLLDLQILEDLLHFASRDNLVVLMAGGTGSRLRPLTDQLPKPMLPVGNRPLLETILASFLEQGFRRFVISLNYKAHVISDYFGDGSRWGVEIEYVRETKRLGTAGPLRLLPERPTAPLVVMNADLLTRVDFGNLLDYHAEHRAKATLCVRDHAVQIPYGVVQHEGNRFVGVEEKPVQHCFVSAGIYVLEPEVIDLVPKNRYFDMTDLFGRISRKGLDALVFPIREYWLDIGELNQFLRANRDFPG